MQAEAFALVAHLLQLGVLQPMAGAADAAGRRRRRRRRRRGASGGDSVRLVLDEGKQTKKKEKLQRSPIIDIEADFLYFYLKNRISSADL